MKKTEKNISVKPGGSEVWLPEYQRNNQGIPIAIAYPNKYTIGMASLGFLTVYRYLYDAGFKPERFFLDVTDSKSRYVSVESGKILSSFDLIAFHFSFELDYINAIKMLIESRIEPLRENRNRQPIVFGGGIASSSNPLPLVDFLDAVFIGETSAEIISGFYESIYDDEPFDKVFRDFFICEKYVENSAGKYSSDFQIDPDWEKTESYSPVITQDSAFGKMNLIEISSGCPIRCKFCLSGNMYPSVRERSVDTVMRGVSRFSPQTAKAGLIGSIPSLHSEIDNILDSLLDNGYKFSLSSLSVSSLRKSIIEKIASGGMKTLTLGVESFDERVQRKHGKLISMDKLLDGIGYALDSGMREIKIYLMLGLPGSDENEIDIIVENVLEIRERINQSKSGAGFSISLNPFIPKVATIYEGENFMGEKYFKDGMKKLKKSVVKFGIDIKSESYRMANLQYLLSNSDEISGNVILQMAKGLKQPELPDIIKIDLERYIKRSQDRIRTTVIRAS